MGAVIKAPITNFLSLADIDAAANQARAAEQQYQLRDLQIKDSMRKQQEASDLRNMTRAAYTPGTPGSPGVAHDDGGAAAFMGADQPQGLYDMAPTPATQGRMDYNKLGSSLEQAGYADKAMALKSAQTKQTSEQMKAVSTHLKDPNAWGEGGVLYQMAPDQYKAAFARPYDEATADAMSKALLTEIQKSTIQHQKDTLVETGRHNRITEQTQREKVQEKKDSKKLKSSDINTLKGLAVQAFGGVMDALGNITALDPSKAGNVQAAIDEAAKIMQEDGIDHASAMSTALRKLGQQIPNLRPSTQGPTGPPQAAPEAQAPDGRPLYRWPDGKLHTGPPSG